MAGSVRFRRALHAPLEHIQSEEMAPKGPRFGIKKLSRKRKRKRKNQITEDMAPNGAKVRYKNNSSASSGSSLTYRLQGSAPEGKKRKERKKGKNENEVRRNAHAGTGQEKKRGKDSILYLLNASSRKTKKGKNRKIRRSSRNVCKKERTQEHF